MKRVEQQDLARFMATKWTPGSREGVVKAEITSLRKQLAEEKQRRQEIERMVAK